MRKRVSMVIAVAIVMCFAAVADAQPGRGPGGRGPRGPSSGGFGGFGLGKLQLLRIAAVQKELEMTDEQIEQIQKLQEELRADSPFGRFRGRGRGEGRSEDGERRRRPSRPDSDEGARSEFRPGEYFVQDEDEEDDRPRRGGFQQLSEEERQERMEQFRKAMEERRKKEEDGLKKILLPHQLKRLNEIALQLQGLRALQNPQVVEELGIKEKQQEEIREVQAEAREKFRDNKELREAFQSRDREKIREAFTKIQKEIEKDVLGCLTSSQRKQFEKMKGEPFELSDEDRRSAFGFGGRGGFRGPGGPQGGERRPERPQRPDA